MDKKTGQRPDRATLMHCWIIGFVQDREDSGLDTFPKDIEKEFSINRSTTSEMLKLMCKKGMIEREEVEYDARLKKIVLTESSRNHNRQIEDKMKEMHQKLIKDLSEEEIKALLQKQVDDSSISFSISSDPVFKGKKAFIVMANPRYNAYDIDYVITIDGKEIIRTAKIAPNQYIEEVELKEALPKGTYTGEALVTGYNKETGEEVGKTIVELNITSQ